MYALLLGDLLVVVVVVVASFVACGFDFVVVVSQ
jgi:hypothetical protein